MAARFLNGMLDEGTRNKTRQQIRDEFSRLKAQVFFFGAGNDLSAQITTTRANVIPTLRLVAEVMKEPAFDRRSSRSCSGSSSRTSTKTSPIRGPRPSPRSSARISPYPKGHPLYVQTVDEQIADMQALTVDEVKKVYTDLVGATYGDIAVAGDFPRDSVLDVARELFGSWRNPKPFARLVRETTSTPRRRTTRSKRPTSRTRSSSPGMNLKVRDDSKDYAALTLGNYMLGGGFLNSRLAVRIRQKEGISYGVGSGLSAQSLDSVGTFTANAIYNPENVNRLETAFREELDRVLKDGFTAEEVDKAKQGWLQQQLQNRSSDGFLVSLFSQQAVSGRTMTYNTQFEKWVADLTPNDVNGAMRKYIDQSKITIVKAGDFKNHPPKGPNVVP